MSRLVPLIALAGLLLAGCAQVRPQAAFDDVRATLDGRTGADARWITGATEDAEARAAVARLLADSLTSDAAVQVALLNNRHLQATYEDLGLAQAALVQAGLLANPVFGAGVLWPLGGGAPDLRFRAAFEFLDVLYVPLRRRVAASEYEAARARAASAVLALAGRTRVAFVRAQADAARLAAQRRIVGAAEAGYTASRLLRDAGNVTAVDLLAEQALYEDARLELVALEARAAESRDAFARLLGLAGPAASLRLAGALPPVPAAPDEPFVSRDAAGEPVLDVAAIERAAVAASLDLAAARADLDAAARRAGVARPESVLPSLSSGGELERSDGEWEAGPEASVRLPLFDAGQARRAAAQSDLRRRIALYEATAVDVRASARTLAARVAAARRTAVQYQTVVLPLRAELVRQTLLQYNAMQVGVFNLLQAQQLEAAAVRRTVDAVEAYWTTRADLDLLLAGVAPDVSAGAVSPAPRTVAPAASADAH